MEHKNSRLQDEQIPRITGAIRAFMGNPNTPGVDCGLITELLLLGSQRRRADGHVLLWAVHLFQCLPSCAEPDEDHIPRELPEEFRGVWTSFYPELCERANGARMIRDLGVLVQHADLEPDGRAFLLGLANAIGGGTATVAAWLENHSDTQEARTRDAWRSLSR